ncbi:recombinase RecT [Methylobacterium organophilum]|nr:recombinase RecT [Methylobacterium organophilum]
MSGPAFEATLRGTVFPGNGTREEFAAFLLVAREYRLNPITRQIYAFPKKGGGIIPVVSIDGWLYLVNEHPAFDGMEFDHQLDDQGNLVSITCRIYRKDRKMPIVVTEFLSECIRATDPWKMKNRMLRHKAMIQCARYAFNLSGIYDEDEAERFADERKLEQRRAQIAGSATPPVEAPRGPAAPPVEAEEAEIVEAGDVASDPAIVAVDVGRESAQHPPLAQEEAFDPEAWLDEARERFQEARTEADVSDVHEMFADTANDLGMTERQRYEDMLQAAEARVRTQGQPEQAEVTGEPGPAPDEAQDAAQDDEDDDTIPSEPVAPAPPQKTEGELYLERIRAAINEPGRTYKAVGDLWNATKPQRLSLIEKGEITKAQSKELFTAIMGLDGQAQPAAPAGPGPSAPPAEEDEVTAYDRSFRARVEACQTIEEIGNLSAGTLAERAKFAGNPLQAEWKALVADRRKAIAGIS